MSFDCQLLVIVHNDKQQVIAVEFVRGLDQRIELELPSISLTYIIYGDYYSHQYPRISHEFLKNI